MGVEPHGEGFAIEARGTAEGTSEHLGDDGGDRRSLRWPRVGGEAVL